MQTEREAGLERVIGDKASKAAWFRAKQERKKPCKVCGLHGCVCQISLHEFGG